MKYSEWYVPVVILCYSTDKNLSDKSEIQWLWDLFINYHWNTKKMGQWS